MKKLIIIIALAAVALSTLVQANTVLDTAGVRTFADITTSSGGPKGADMVIMLGQNKNGEMVVTGIAAVAQKNARIPPQNDAHAIVRTRSAKKKHPDGEDIQFAAQQKVPVFSAGTWKSPTILWQIDAGATPAQYRVIDAQGLPGPWQAVPQ